MFFQGCKNRHSEEELKLFEAYIEYFTSSPLPISNKLQAFTKYVRRQDIARFLAKNEIFKLQLDVPGVIIECGVYTGGGLMTFAQLSAIYEPYNHTRKIIGFDTFTGFPNMSNNDKATEADLQQNNLSTFDGIEEEILQAVRLFDLNRPLRHIPKVEIIKGDALITIPMFVKQNPQIIISLLYLDFDLYEPTKIALQQFLPRIPKGGIVAFDELNCPNYPGETLALVEMLGVNNLKLRKTIFDPWISYAVI